MSDHQHPHEMNGEAPVEPQEAPGYEIPPVPAQETRRALTAFLVVVEHDGIAWATNDCNLDVVCDRQATLKDMYPACASVMKDIQVTETTERTVQTMMHMTAQMAEAQRQEKIAQKLMSKGIHVPGR